MEEHTGQAHVHDRLPNPSGSGFACWVCEALLAGGATFLDHEHAGFSEFERVFWAVRGPGRAMTTTVTGRDYSLWACETKQGSEQYRILGAVGQTQGIYGFAAWCSEHLMLHVHTGDGMPDCNAHAEPTLTDAIHWVRDQVRAAHRASATCDAQRASGAWDGRVYTCDHPLGHGGPHHDKRFAATWLEGWATVLDPFGLEGEPG